jgi:tRNA-uridine 2-sulfurtransferase
VTPDGQRRRSQTMEYLTTRVLKKTHMPLIIVVKLVVGRNQNENYVMRSLALKDDIVIEAQEFPGPTCILRSKNYEYSLVEKSCRIVLRYSDSPSGRETNVKVTYRDQVSVISTIPMGNDELENLRI